MPSITPAQLFVAFFQIGIQGFGGVLPYARRSLVEKRRWLTPEEFLEQWSLCQALPGGNITNMSVAFGRRCAGPVGALAALVGLVCGPFVVICALGWVYTRYGALPQVESIFRGVSAVGAGLVIATGVRMAMTPRMRSSLALFAVAAFIMTALLRWPLGWVLGLLIPMCLFWVWRQAK
jgi:chromate transporter